MKINVSALDDALEKLSVSATSYCQWEGALDAICEATSSVSAVIVPILSRTPGLVATDNMRPVLETYFEDEWHLRDFRMRGLPHLFRKGTMLEQDYATEDDFKNEGYYKFLKKYGLRWTAMASFETGPQDSSCFVLYRRVNDDAYDREEEHILSRMRDHLTNAALMSREFSAARVQGMSDGFEMTNCAAVFFDRTAHVTQLNPLAEKLLGHGIQINRREVQCWKRNDAETLTLRIKQVIETSSLLSGAAEPVLISRENMRPLVVRVQRLAGNLADVFSHSVAVALIANPEVRTATSPIAIMTIFKLTRTEALLALDLAAGNSPREISDKRKLSYSTVRSHLRSIYDKTGTGRQSDLVSLIASLAGM